MIVSLCPKEIFSLIHVGEMKEEAFRKKVVGIDSE